MWLRFIRLGLDDIVCSIDGRSIRGRSRTCSARASLDDAREEQRTEQRADRRNEQGEAHDIGEKAGRQQEDTGYQQEQTIQDLGHRQLTAPKGGACAAQRVEPLPPKQRGADDGGQHNDAERPPQPDGLAEANEDRDLQEWNADEGDEDAKRHLSFPVFRPKLLSKDYDFRCWTTRCQPASVTSYSGRCGLRARSQTVGDAAGHGSWKASVSLISFSSQWWRRSSSCGCVTYWAGGTGHERRPQSSIFGRRAESGDKNVIPLPERSSPSPREEDTLTEPQATPVAEAAANEGASVVTAGIAQIKSRDPNFDASEFLAGSRVAYEMIVVSFANGDIDTLRPLLADDVYSNFASAIDEREGQKETLETTLVAIDSADVIEARLNGGLAEITVKFVSELVNVTRNAEGEIVSGDPRVVDTITDLWTFARDVRASDPNWRLVATSSPN